MKVQYFGDINDYAKFALLRRLALQAKFRLGICWMMTAPDGTGDGGKRSFVFQPAHWRHYDLGLFDVLASVPAQPDMSDLAKVEAENLVPGAIFIDETTPDELLQRTAFHRSCLAKFADADVVFFDPDNGLDVQSAVKGRRNSSKYIFLDEVSEHYNYGRSVLVYQHLPRKPRSTFIQQTSDRLRSALPGSQVWAFETAHVVFLMATQPHHSAQVAAVAAHVEAKWSPLLFRRAQNFA